MHKSTFEEEISRTGKLIYTNVGDSMMPLIRQNRDLLIIEKVSGRLKKYEDRKSTRLNSSHEIPSRMPSSA